MSANAAVTGRRGAYIPSLDGWRTIAILWVMLSHNAVFHLGPISDIWVQQRGSRGVDLFFALSGILICGRLLQEEKRSGAISLKSFYVRRLFRIQPAALLFLAVLSVLLLTGVIYRLDVYRGSPWLTQLSALLMMRNLWPKTFLFENSHFWSLSVEEHFYIFLPAFLIVCKRYRLTVMGVLLVVALIWRIIYFMKPRGAEVFNRTDLCCGTILLGCVFALALAKANVRDFAVAYVQPWLALLYAAGALVLVEIHHSRADYALLISIYPLLITATMLHAGSWTTRLLEWAPMRFVGRISYSLYLWQELFFDPYDPAPAGSFRTHVVWCWIAAFACAIASYFLVETPLIRWGHKIARGFDVDAPAKKIAA